MREKIRDISSARSVGSNSSKSVRADSSPRGVPPRRLAAIVVGDIAGYSRLMELDEEGTHVRVKRIQRDLIEPSITEHYGRLVKTTGDGCFQDPKAQREYFGSFGELRLAWDCKRRTLVLAAARKAA